MEFEFISKKPWVDETVKLRKALFFTTLFMIILGVILGIIGVVLLAYMEFVVGVIAIIFAILLPACYVGMNVLLFARRRKDYDKNMIIEYKFTEDALEIIKLSDTYKAKDVIDYVNLNVNKVYNKSRFIIIKTKSRYNDYIVLRKSDIKLEDGANRSQVIVSFVSFLMAKVAEAARTSEVTCADPNENKDVPAIDVASEVNDEQKAMDNAISGQNEENVDMSAEPNAEQIVKFEDLTTTDEVVDIEDEQGEVEPTHSKFDIINEEVEEKADALEDATYDAKAVDEDSDDNANDVQYEEVPCQSDNVDAITQDDEQLGTKDNYDELFDYNDNVDGVVEEEKKEKTDYFQDYSYDDKE